MATLDQVSLEVQVFDENHQLIDSFRGSYGDRIEPGEEVSFKVADYRDIHLPEAQYKSHKVLVREAKPR